VISKLEFGRYRIYFLKRVKQDRSISSSLEQLSQIGKGETFNFWQMNTEEDEDSISAYSRSDDSLSVDSGSDRH
jgi:hypothetical protein